MIFRTPLQLSKNTENLIDYNADILLIGSCFSENIGKKLAYYKFQQTVNPVGILFHPKAVEKFIFKAVHKQKFTEKDVFFYNERWHCFDAHSSVSATNKSELLNNLNTAISKTYQQLPQTTHIIITLGTSWVYKHIETNNIVANCHKIPQKKFEKKILSVDEISRNLNTISSLIHSINNDISIVYTVSPIRHIKDGIIENQQSKAHLIAAIHNTQQHYFPSYEIMMDELRDYRFYAEDMIHPNKTAISYIWERFCEVWISSEALKTMEEVNTIQKGLAHRPFNPNSEQHLKFLKNLQKKKETLLKTFPFMKF